MFFMNPTVKYVLVGLVVVVAAKLAWTHRGDDWVQALLRPQGPAKVEIKFDNGSVRDAALPSADRTSQAARGQTVRNEAGELKKCLIAGKIVYTEQVCPAGAKVAAVNGGNFAVMDTPKPKPGDHTSAQGARKTLHDALDLSGGEDIKARMMERAVNQ